MNSRVVAGLLAGVIGVFFLVCFGGVSLTLPEWLDWDPAPKTLKTPVLEIVTAG